MLQTVANMLVANAITAAVIYGFWRIKRDENDMRGVLWLLIPCLIVAAVGFGSRWERQQEREAAAQSATMTVQPAAPSR
jgi:Zn-dependent protease with chaperone function